MAVTRLKRKARVNKGRAVDRKATIKRLSWSPVIRKVDIEELKASFKKTKTAPKKAEKTEEEASAE